jgi:hypothetical protein
MGSRAERRRQAKDDRRLLASGLDLASGGAARVAALMRLLHDLLEEARDAGTVAPLADFLHAQLRASDRLAPRKAIACRIYCAHCCHAWVSARAPEVLAVAAAVPAARRDAVRAAVNAAHALTGALDADARAGRPTPCPLLGADRLCTVYEARPAVCRTAVSQSVEACARAYAPGGEEVGIPTPDFHIELRAGFALALAGALKRSGFEPAAYEYNGALAAVLARPDAEAAWLAGEDVFAGVRRDPTGDPFRLPRNRALYDAAWAG